MTFQAGPRLPSRRHTVCRRVRQQATSRGRDVSRIRESSSCLPISAVATRGGNATTAVASRIINAAGLRRDRLVVARAAAPRTSDVAVRRRATRGALTRIVAVTRHEAPLCGWMCRPRPSSVGQHHLPRRPEVPNSVCFICVFFPTANGELTLLFDNLTSISYMQLHHS